MRSSNHLERIANFFDGGGGSIDEFYSVDISEGVDGMHDEDIFEAEEVMDKSNIYEWGGMSVV